MNQGTMMIKYYYSTLSIVTAVKTTLKDTTKETFSLKALMFSAKKILGSFDELESTATLLGIYHMYSYFFIYLVCSK